MEREKKKEPILLFGIVKIAMEEIGYGGTVTSSAYVASDSGATFTNADAQGYRETRQL